MDVYLDTLGCRLNEAELSSWTREFEASGHRVVRRPEGAHVIVFNTCAVTAEAARKSRRLVRRLHRSNPNAQLVVTGCYAALEPGRVADLMGVDLVIGNHEKANLVDTVLSTLDPSVMPEIATEPDSSHMYRKTRHRAFVKIQDGCKNRCTFCVVTIARGDERSRTEEALLEEVRHLSTQGYQEVVLTGVHLGGYGRDIGTNLFSLVKRVLEETTIPRVRLGSLEPWDLPENFWDLWSLSRPSGAKLCPHLHLPLQSGSDSVLKRMARRCDKARYRALVEGARRSIPDLTVTTDLIVGFPGETAEEWQETVSFVKEIGFGHMHIFTYSPREGTTAARMKGHLKNDVKRERSRELHTLAADMKAAHFQRFVGVEKAVLWEGRAAIEEDERRWGGYTENYLKVSLRLPVGDQTSLTNVLSRVKITGYNDVGLEGELVVE